MPLALFPLYGITPEGVCACGNESCSPRNAGKHPAVSGWQNKGVPGYAPKDGDGYGICTGSASGIFVIDLDGPDAIEHFRKLGECPDTFTVRTGREEPGAHLYFRLPPGESIKNDVGRKLGHVKIDVRGEGGYVVGPGSPHRSGRRYEAMNVGTPIADAPAWLLDRVRMDATERRAASAMAPKPVDPESPEGERRLKLAIQYLTEEAPPAIQGEDGSGTLWIVAQKLVRTWELPLDVALTLLTEAYNDRCQPPWSERELLHKLEDARDRGTWLTGCPSENFPQNLIDAGKRRKDREFREAAGAAEEPPRAEGEPRTMADVIVNRSLTSKVSFDKITFLLSRAEEWANVLRYNVLTRRPTAISPPFPMRLQNGVLSDGDVGKIRIWLAQHHGYQVSSDTIRQAVAMVCEEPDRAYNPFAEYLDGLPKVAADEPLQLDIFHETILKTGNPFHSLLWKKHLVAAVRRARAMPGIGQKPRPVDHQAILVLAGKQDWGKGYLCKTLAIEREWYHSMKGDLADKDTIIKAAGHIIVELEELTTATKADREALKAFLSADEDFERAAYERAAEQLQRSYIMIATTNDPRLEDPTGHRRFHCIELSDTPIDIPMAAHLRDRFWAEADMLARTGYDHHLTADEKLIAAQLIEEGTFEIDDSTTVDVTNAVKGKSFVTLRDVYNKLGGLAPVIPRSEEHRLSSALRRAGCVQGRVNGVRGWKVPKELTDAKAPSRFAGMADKAVN